MTLQDEIRKVLSLSNDMEPEDIRRVVYDRRADGTRKQKSIKRFKKIMADMDDVETYIDSNNIWKRRLVKPNHVAELESQLARIIKIVLEYYRELLKLCQKMQKSSTDQKSGTGDS